MLWTLSSLIVNISNLYMKIHKNNSDCVSFKIFEERNHRYLILRSVTPNYRLYNRRASLLFYNLRASLWLNALFYSIIDLTDETCASLSYTNKKIRSKRWSQILCAHTLIGPHSHVSFGTWKRVEKGFIPLGWALTLFQV